MGTTELFVELIVIGIGAFTQVDLWQQRVSGQPDVHLGKSVDRLFFPFLAGSPGTNFKIRNTGD